MEFTKVSALIPLCIALSAPATVRYVDINCPQPGSPYTVWSSAATNIQDAIDASIDGDFIWVTNGVYATGGAVMSGDLTNRVALNKAITVQSVNGPYVTIIQGAGATNGTGAVRCAWLTNYAVLQGFTLRAGATRNILNTTTGNGGAVWCASSNATVANCLILSNTASTYAAAYQGTLRNCGLLGNWAQTASAAYNCQLYNCTVCSNYQSTAVSGGALTNCIVYFNAIGNVSSPSIAYCCTPSFASGPGNITANPQLLPDAIHLAASSSCRGAGINVALGTDIDGQSWSNPPSMGCDEWQPAPIVSGAPLLQLTGDPVGFNVTAMVAGQAPFTCLWLRNGVPVQNDGHFSSADTTNLVAAGVSSADAGSYQFVASNAWGMTTGVVVNLVIHCVNATSVTPTPPFTNWSTAATTIQDAINSAGAGEVVLVTNGVYASGGVGFGTGLSNRVAVTKALLVQSINGPGPSIIQGAWDPTSTNGPLAVRCVWLATNSILSGFTLRGGATLASDLTVYTWTNRYGGGVYGPSGTNATVVNCVLTGNAAYDTAGGAYSVKLLNCTLNGNMVIGTRMSSGGADSCYLRNCLVTGNSCENNGGGAERSALFDCAIIGNSAKAAGGGVAYCSLVNCTLFGNFAGDPTRSINGTGGGAYNCKLTNCIVYGNRAFYFTSIATNNYDPSTCTLAYCDSSPAAPGVGNISSDPQLLPDHVHVAATSPCRGSGTNIVVIGTDIDGQPWARPPSMGCDEWSPAPALIGPPQFLASGVPAALNASASLAGQAPFSFWWVKDGVPLDDNAHYGASHTANLIVSNFGPADAGGYQLIVSNSFGIATSSVAQVVIHCVDPASLAPLPPYSDWSSAAATLQDAVDAANAGEFVLATNGTYNTGGRPVGSGTTNRLVIASPLTVVSVNGPGATAINGTWDPNTTNGPAAVRGVWVADGATLSGFTVQNGATSGDSGGGIYGASTNAYIVNCIITNNQAATWGAGCYQGLLTNCVLMGNVNYNQGGAAYHSLILNSLISSNYAHNGGGGTYSCTIVNSKMTGNSAYLYGGASSYDIIYGSLLSGNISTNGGGAADHSTLYNCTVTGNRAGLFGGGGTYLGTARNCIIYYNDSQNFSYPNYNGSSISYSCTTPAGTGTGNISVKPQLLDGVHIAANSPCRGTGSAAYAAGTDIDGEPWANPPSMGCDEVWDANLTGPLSVSLTPQYTTVAQFGWDALAGAVIGRASRVAWDFGDGSSVSNASYIGYGKVWTNTGDYTVTLTAFNTDNPAGVSTTALIHVVPLVSPLISASGLNGHNFTVTFAGQPGVMYMLDVTTNLSPPVIWNYIWSTAGTGGNATELDFQAADPWRFYRIRVQFYPPWSP